MASSLSKSIDSPNNNNAQNNKLIQSNNDNKCDFLINMLSEQCTLCAGFATVRHLCNP